MMFRALNWLYGTWRTPATKWLHLYTTNSSSVRFTPLLSSNFVWFVCD